MTAPQIVTNDAAASGSTKDIRSNLRLNKMVGRYWGEAVVIALALLLWVPRLSGPIDLRWDAGVYYVLGTSLATGQGYRIVSEPGSPEAVQYPPLLPAIVALHQWMLGTTNPEVVAPWLRKFNAAVFVLFALAALTLARRYLALPFALLAVALCLLQVNTVFLSDLLFPELPFALITILFAVVTVDTPLVKRPWLQEAGPFALAAAGYFIRTAGLSLLAAWVLEAVVRRRWRPTITRCLLALIPVLVWQTYIARVHSSYAYTHPAYEYQRASYQFNNVSYAENAALIDPFRPELGRVDARAFGKRLMANARTIVVAIGQAVSTREAEWTRLFQKTQLKVLGYSVFSPAVVLLPLCALAALVLAGLMILLRQGAWLLLLIIVGFVGLVWITPWTIQFPRYLTPLTCFFAIAAVLALSQLPGMLLGSELHRLITPARVAICGIVVVMFSMEVYTTIRYFRERASSEGVLLLAGNKGKGFRLFAHDRPWQAWEECANWLHDQARSGAIVATSAPHLLYLYTSLRAVFPPMEADAARERRLLETVPISYVIIDDFEFIDASRRYALPAIEPDPARWQVIHSFDATKIYGYAEER